MDSNKIIYAILIPLLLIICVQLCLVSPDTRELFTKIESKEGVNYRSLFQNKRLYVNLELKEGTPSADIVILYNSREVSKFVHQSITLPVECDGVFQIRNGTDEDIAVAVSSKESGKLTVINYIIPEGIHALCSVRL